MGVGFWRKPVVKRRELEEGGLRGKPRCPPY